MEEIFFSITYPPIPITKVGPVFLSLHGGHAFTDNSRFLSARAAHCFNKHITLLGDTGCQWICTCVYMVM